MKPILSALFFLMISTTGLRADSLVLGGGCFWCLDASYRLLPGVTNVTSGYAGGTVTEPSYEEVCSGRTGHAEVVKIDYDPAKTSLKTLLDFFWEAHNATQVGGQGNDYGSQYRSVILYANEEQKSAAEASLKEAQKNYSDPITTEVVALTKFWPAEDYHQDYFAKHPERGYCAMVISPKVQKLRKHLAKP